MRRPSKRIILTIGAAIGLLILLALAVLLVDVNRHKPRFELAASNALGMDVRIGGRLSMGFFPSFHLAAKDCRILGEHGVSIASAKRVRLWVQLLPLLRNEFRLRRIELREPKFSIERDTEGRLNVERVKAAALLGALDGVGVSLSDGTLLYSDRRSGAGFDATGLDLAVSHVRLGERGSSQLLKNLSLNAELTCREIRTKNVSVSALKALVDARDGVIEFKPVTMRIFGGQEVGSVLADVSGPVPDYQVRCDLSRFRIEEFLRILSPQKAAEGAMDFSASLSMRGKTGRQLVQTAAGEIALRSGQLTLVGNDLDQVLSRFESSQNFNLVDVGAVFFAGPLGLAVTKGYNFSGLFAGTGGSSRITTVVSNWRVERGVVQAKDVAMATTKNRIALQGGLDFVNERFVDVTVAAIDAAGCARVRQAIRGSFAKPVVEKPRVLTALAGPVVKLYRRMRHIFPAGPCEVFYSGSVAPPR
jgi:uncharacterized protein involved in outer membrane biogenesis